MTTTSTTCRVSTLDAYLIRIHQKGKVTVYFRSDTGRNESIDRYILPLPKYRLSEVISSINISYKDNGNSNIENPKLLFPSPSQQSNSSQQPWRRFIQNHINKQLIIFDTNKNKKHFGKLLAISTSTSDGYDSLVLQNEQTHEIYVTSFDNSSPPPIILCDSNTNMNDSQNINYSDTEDVIYCYILNNNTNEILNVDYSFYTKENHLFDFVYTVNCLNHDGVLDYQDERAVLNCFVILSNPLPFKTRNVSIKLFCDDHRYSDFLYKHSYESPLREQEQHTEDEKEETKESETWEDDNELEVTKPITNSKNSKKWFSLKKFPDQRAYKESLQHLLRAPTIYTLPKDQYTLEVNKSLKTFLFTCDISMKKAHYFSYESGDGANKNKITKATTLIDMYNNNSHNKYEWEDGKVIIKWDTSSKFISAWVYSCILNDVSGSEFTDFQTAVHLLNIYEHVREMNIQKFVINPSNDNNIYVHQLFERYICFNVHNHEYKGINLEIDFYSDVVQDNDEDLCTSEIYKITNHHNGKEFIQSGQTKGRLLRFGSIHFKSKERGLIMIKESFVKEKHCLFQKVLSIGRIQELLDSRMINSNQLDLLYRVILTDRKLVKCNRMIRNIRRKKTEILKQIEKLCLRHSHSQLLVQLLDSMENIISKLDAKVELYRNSVNHYEQRKSDLRDALVISINK